MATTVIITTNVVYGVQTLVPGVQLDVSDAVARQWIDARQAMAAGSTQVPTPATPDPAKRKTKG